MYIDYSFICPICGNEEKLSVNNSLINKDVDNNRQIVILNKNDDDTFNCEVNVRCTNCRHTFREKRKIAYVNE